MACAHCLGVFHGSAPKLSTGIFVVDTSSPAAGLALGGYRPTEEATYVLCRTPSERRSEFADRVLRRVHRIVAQRSLGSLWYVVGSGGFDGAQLLLQALVPLLDDGGSLTVAGPRSQSASILRSIEALLRQRAGSIDVRARFHPDAAGLEQRLFGERGIERPLAGPRTIREAWPGERVRIPNLHAHVRTTDGAFRALRSRRSDEASVLSR